MIKRMLHSSRGIFVTCVVITNLLSSFITAFIWLNVFVYVPTNHRPQSPLLPMLISPLVAIPISSVVSKRSAKPLQDMVKATKSISKGDYSVRVEESGAGDVYELLHSFNQMTAELGSTEMMRNDFINTFSHEFKTPIVSIRGFAKRLKNENLSPEKRKEYLEYIAEESEQLSNLASSVLLVARYDNQKLVAERLEYDLDEQIRNCVLRMETVWSAKNITFDVDLPKLTYVNNVEMMEHVWMNLISNAIKFSYDGGHIFISSSQTADNISVSIRDEGIGISASEIGHIFDKFYQADTAHSSVGNGLGLSLVYRIIQLSGGSISAKSEVGKGTEFTVALPLLRT